MNKRSRKTRHAISGFTFLLLIGACGNPAPEDQATPQDAARPEATTDAEALDACRYFSKAEAETALGISLQDPELTPYNPVTKASECTFEPADTSGGFETSGSLLIRVEQPTNPEASFAQLRELMGDVEEESGVGDQAFYAASQLFVLAGAYQVTVAVGLFGNRGGERRETAVTVAETVLSRL